MKKPTTFEDLRAVMIESAVGVGIIVPPMIGIQTDEDHIWEPTDENILWFVALTKATVFQDASLTEIAYMFLDGTEPITKETVPGWLAQFYDDDDHDGWSDLQYDITNFFRSRLSR